VDVDQPTDLAARKQPQQQADEDAENDQVSALWRWGDAARRIGPR
jgi:hypothetical protein